MIASILINSKNIENLDEVLNSYEENAYDPNNFEIIININPDDINTKKYLDNQIVIRKFKLKYIMSYEGDYFSGHINNNKMLNEVDAKSYFISCTGDRVKIKTKNWDKKLSAYINLFKDDIYRIKCSKFKNRKYFDYWECCFAPANITFTTKKSLNINNNFSPCFSHDAFQQCIYFYLEKHDNFNSNQLNRDIIDSSLEFTGDTPEVKNEEDNYKRIHGQLKAWNILTSVKIQKEAYRRAMIMKANIKYNNLLDNHKIYDLGSNICIENKSSGVVEKYNYNVNGIKIVINNFIRKFSYLNYCGSGFKDDSYPIVFSIFWYLDFRYNFFRGIKDLYKKFFR